MNTLKNKAIGLMLAMSLVFAAGSAMAQEFPQPGPEHNWLQQMVGEWETEMQAYMEPGEPPVVSQGTETIRPLGEFWTISDIEGTMMDKPFLGNLTLGYDAKKQKYVGTWVDSMTGHLWQYDGTVDESGKVLTLEAEGTCPMHPGRTTTFRDIIEFQDENTKTWTSKMLDENGQWVTVMVGQSKRKQ